MSTIWDHNQIKSAGRLSSATHYPKKSCTLGSIVKLRITLHDSEADDEQLDRLALSLIRQLRDLEAIESLEREAGKAIDRSKGDSITVGGVILGVAVVAIPNLISLLQQWTVGNRTIKVEAPNGAKAEFTPDHRYSKEEIAELVRSLNRIKQ